MAGFADDMLLRFLDDGFVSGVLAAVGEDTLFNTTYDAQQFDVEDAALASIERRQFEAAAFETIRTTGTDERSGAAPDRSRIDRAQPRLGRLSWVDVFLDVALNIKLRSQAAPLESVTVSDLLEELGPVATIADLRTKLKTRFADSVVDAFFSQLRITNLEEFRRRGSLWLEFAYKTPPPYDPNDPANMRRFLVNVCVKFQPELAIRDTLREAKLCRSILENEHDYAENFAGGEVANPYVFLVIFPESAATNNAIPGLTANQIKSKVKALFAAERMVAHFVAAN